MKQRRLEIQGARGVEQACWSQSGHIDSSLETDSWFQVVCRDVKGINLLSFGSLVGCFAVLEDKMKKYIETAGVAREVYLAWRVTVS